MESQDFYYWTLNARRNDTQKKMAVTKFQVMLNDILLEHKASLLLYNEIIELVL